MLKDPEKQRAYRRQYDLARYYRRRAEAISQLGGKCVKCGTASQLEFDHIDPETKSFDLANFSVSEKRFQEELSKCQLLCRTCHALKTVYDLGKQPKRCGTYYSYRQGCRCNECKSAEKEQRKKWRGPIV